MTVWTGETRVNGEVAFRVGRDGDKVIAEWPNVATLVVDRAGVSPVVSTAREADPAIVEKLRAGPIRALIAHLKGGLALHASSVAIGDAACAFVGDSGAGKSSLALALTRRNAACELLSDDCLILEEDLAQPTESLCWIDDDARAALHVAGEHGKRGFRPQQIATRGRPLRTIFHLAFGAEHHIRRLRGNAVAAVLGRAMIRFVLDEPEIHRRDMSRLAMLARELDVYELERPHGFEHLNVTLADVDRFLSRGDKPT